MSVSSDSQSSADERQAALDQVLQAKKDRDREKQERESNNNNVNINSHAFTTNDISARKKFSRANSSGGKPGSVDGKSRMKLFMSDDLDLSHSPSKSKSILVDSENESDDQHVDSEKDAGSHVTTSDATMTDESNEDKVKVVNESSIISSLSNNSLINMKSRARPTSHSAMRSSSKSLDNRKNTTEGEKESDNSSEQKERERKATSVGSLVEKLEKEISASGIENKKDSFRNSAGR